MKQWLAAAWLSALPWTGCDRSPVEPPASPPSERAPIEVTEPRHDTAPQGPILLDARRRLG